MQTLFGLRNLKGISAKQINANLLLVFHMLANESQKYSVLNHFTP